MQLETMIIEVDNLTARVTNSTEKELEWLYRFLKFEDQSTKFTRRRDGSVQFNKPKSISLLSLVDTFPAGLVRQVKRGMLKEGMLLKIVDKRIPPCRVLSWEEALAGRPQWLHDFQLEAIEASLARTRGILDMPTGSGKTETAVGLAMRLGETNTLFVAPEKDLMHNAARRWEKRTGVEAGRIGDGWMKPLDGFTAATFQTLAARLNKDSALSKYLPTVGCSIFDEVHTLPSDSFFSTAQAIPAYYRIGVSGTPLSRGDRKSLFSLAATGSIIYQVGTQLLIDRGFISKPHITMVKCVQGGSAAGWQKSYAANIVNSKKRNTLITNLAVNALSPGLVFVREKRHGRILTEMITARGVRAEFIWGEKNTSQRDDAIRRLCDGDIDIIVCSVVFQTGTDIPEVMSLVNAAGGKSEIATLQRIGRGMRIVKDSHGVVIKDQFYVYDIMDDEPPGQSDDTGNRWNARHSKERFKSYTKVGHEVVMKAAA